MFEGRDRMVFCQLVRLTCSVQQEDSLGLWGSSGSIRYLIVKFWLWLVKFLT